MTVTLTSTQYQSITQENINNIKAFIDRMTAHSWYNFFEGVSYDKSSSNDSWIGYYTHITGIPLDNNFVRVKLGNIFYNKACFRTFTRYDSFRLFCQEFVSTYLACKGSQVFTDGPILDEDKEFLDRLRRRFIPEIDNKTEETFGGLPSKHGVGSSVETLPKGEDLTSVMQRLQDEGTVIRPRKEDIASSTTPVVKPMTKVQFDNIRNDQLGFVREVNEQLENAARNLNTNLVCTVKPENAKHAEKIVEWFSATGFDVRYDQPKTSTSGGHIIFKFR